MAPPRTAVVGALLLASVAAALPMPTEDRKLGLWLLDPSRTSAEVSRGVGALTDAAAPSALALCMGSWAAQQKGGAGMARLADRLAGRVGEAARGPRAGEVLANTARAFAVHAASSPDEAPARYGPLFRGLAVEARARRESLDAAAFAVTSRSFAAAREAGCYEGELSPLDGAAPAPVAAAAHASLASLERVGAAPPGGVDAFAVRRVAGLLATAKETAELLDLAAPLWEASRVDGDAGARTSETASLRDAASRASAAVDAVSARAAAVFGLPRSHCETLQLVRYGGPAAKYDLHHDCLDDETAVLLGGQRVGTVLGYLSDVPAGAGAETSFPAIGLSVRPRAGTAVAWANVGPGGAVDDRARHRAAPPAAALDPPKVALNCWIRAFPDADRL